MKSYPSIPHANHGGLGETLHTFDKLDGSNIRAEWTKKKGWNKFGTRRRLVDTSDPTFGPAIPLFHLTLAEPLECIFNRQKWQRVIVFCEYWGPKSFAGLHGPGDEMSITLLDVNPYKKGILPPTEFLRYFEEYGPQYFGYFNWGIQFLQKVSMSEFPVTFEGVVGKGKGKGNTINMFKWKTTAWREKVKERYSEEEAAKIIAS